MSIADGVKGYYSMFGLRGLYAVTRARVSGQCYEVSVQVPDIARPVHVRLRTSDIATLSQVMLSGEYECELSRSPAVIVDAGANIGLTSVLFANRYPNAKIFAIEPETSNFALLQRNIAPYPNVVAIPAALWSELVELDVVDPGMGHYGFQTKTVDVTPTCALRNVVRGVTILELMKHYDLTYIDLLKVDIEGAEKEVFEHSAPWLERVGVIAVELHDEFKKGCSRSVYLATRCFELEWRKGETVYFARRPYVKESDGEAAEFKRTAQRGHPPRLRMMF